MDAALTGCEHPQIDQPQATGRQHLPFLHHFCQLISPDQVCTHTHTYALTHAHAHTHTHARTYAHTHAHSRTHMYIYMHPCLTFDPCSTTEHQLREEILRYSFVIYSVFGFVLFDLLYVAVVLTYVSHAQLLLTYIHSVIDKVQTKAYDLGKAVRVSVLIPLHCGTTTNIHVDACYRDTSHVCAIFQIITCVVLNASLFSLFVPILF